MAIEALYWQRNANGVICNLCPRACNLSEGQRGACRSRECRNGEMQLLNYGKTIALSLDPIEKKPLYHFNPGSQILSLGPNSCNLECSFCQNYLISQMDQQTREISPEQLKLFLLKNGLKQVAFTYTEPLTWFEFILDFAAIASGIDIVLVTNAFLNPEAFRQITSSVKAMNIDLKSMNPAFYSKQCKGELNTVLTNIRQAFEAGVHLEITNLLIPGLNDGPADVAALVNFCADLSNELILHFSAYHPAYRLSEPATPASVVHRACELASVKLRYVYAGNLADRLYRDTLCPNCHQIVIRRTGGRSEPLLEPGGICPVCKHVIRGEFSS
ncbi:MAG: AmmeMemoRadiSam system radical SAM enzyme [Candidatus Cloacimonadota bacterium]